MAELAVATWNLLHGIRIVSGESGPAAGSVDLPALSEAAARLDVAVVGLQEVDRAQDRSGHSDQTALVAEALGAKSWRFVPSLRGTPGLTWQALGEEEEVPADEPAYGVGLVSRLPVRSWHVLRFPASRAVLPLLVPGQGLTRVSDEPRIVVAGVAELPGGGTATVATCHLTFVPGANVAQLRTVCRWLSTLPGPRLLLGDLNLPGRVPALASRWRQLARTPTYPSWRPRVQWDHALGSGLAGLVRSATAQAVTAPVSDHCALRVVLHL